MISFSVRNFKEQLKQPLRQVEVDFLIRTFAFACIYFFLFAVFVIGATSLLLLISTKSWVLSLVCGVAGLLLSIALHFMSYRYRNNPLSASSAFVMSIYTVLTFSFLFMFMFFISLMVYILGIGSGVLDVTIVSKVVLFVFGISFLIYLIPAGFGLYISKKKTILTLAKFLNFCYVAYIVFFVLFTVLALFGFGLAYQRAVNIILFFLFGIVLFLSPILTLYRLKTVVPYINYEDAVEKKKWENYFAFEIAFQLLQIALYVLRLLIQVVSHSSRSRLG